MKYQRLQKTHRLKRDAIIISLHLQGHKQAEIARRKAIGLTRERVRQIVNESGLKLNRHAFFIARDRRLFPQEIIKCACGCGRELKRYKYRYDPRHEVKERRFARGHRIKIHPPYEMTDAARSRCSETRKKLWAEGVYDNRRPSAEARFNRAKIVAFLRKNPGCSLTDIKRGTGVGLEVALRYAKKICDIRKVDCGWHWKYSLTLKG